MHSLWLALMVAGITSNSTSQEEPEEFRDYIPEEPPDLEPPPCWLTPKQIAAEEKRARKAGHLRHQLGEVQR